MTPAETLFGSSEEPSLFGLTGRCNRDLRKEKFWGKNYFNNCFPASLAVYMDGLDLHPVYLTSNDGESVEHGEISVSRLFGADPLSSDLFFSFETQYPPYASLVVDDLPRTDLVTMDKPSKSSLRDLEIKLTALPDNATFARNVANQSSELVIRPDTVVYAALSIISSFSERRSELLELLSSDVYEGVDWRLTDEVHPIVETICEDLRRVVSRSSESQSPLMMQPVWRTEGKLLKLAEDCFDIFVWSNLALTLMLADRAEKSYSTAKKEISRVVRCPVWILKMLYDFAIDGNVDPARITSELVYEYRNDKATSISGVGTLPYLKSARLEKPAIHRTAVKEIIRGGGEEYLSPERRLDAVIQSTFDIM